MKKSFFLLTAALVAMFSFYACTDEGGGVQDEPSSSSTTDTSSSSDGSGTGPSSNSTGTSSSSTGASSSSIESSSSSSSDPQSGLEFVKVACNINIVVPSTVVPPPTGTHCWELSGYFPEPEVSGQIAEYEEFCLEYIEYFKEQLSEEVPGAIANGEKADECQAADLECPYSEDGEEFKLYLSGFLTAAWGGECPSYEELFEE
jgi:hypothetical protein